MNAINQFYDLSDKIRYSDFLLNSYSDGEVEERTKESIRNNEYKVQLATIEQELNKSNDQADSIRTAFIQVANELISRITILERRGLFPDLNHGMVVPGALLSHVISYFGETVRYEGGWPIPFILAERAEWDFGILKDKLLSFRDELMVTNFITLMDAVNHYEKIKDGVLQIAKHLRQQGVI